MVGWVLRRPPQDELIGIEHSRVNVIIGATQTIGFSNLTGGSRVTFASAMVATAACDKVVAINLDPGCDMIKRADLSVIGDGAAILQALIAAVDNWRKSARRDAA